MPHLPILGSMEVGDPEANCESIRAQVDGVYHALQVLPPPPNRPITLRELCQPWLLTDSLHINWEVQNEDC